ncbi:MAG TPA: hypothetical protein VK961_18830 [Chthoniobacter sp.]|nr:hypothetical protein [Chthoniobacter sp.]
MKKRLLASLCAVLLPATLVLATSTYDYGVDEYVTIEKGLSPDHKYAITAHGGSETRDEFLRIFLTNAETGKKIGPLEEIKEHLDTGPDAYAAKWSKDSQDVTIVWRIDRHEPLRVVAYHIANGRAKVTKGPTNANKEESSLWAKLCGGENPAPPEKSWGTPVKQ